MKVRVSGKQLEIGEALPELGRTRLEVVVAKHFKGGAEASVVFSHEGSGFRADCTTHLDAGAVINAEGVDDDIHRAFESAPPPPEKKNPPLQAPSKESSRKGQDAEGRRGLIANQKVVMEIADL